MGSYYRFLKNKKKLFKVFKCHNKIYLRLKDNYMDGFLDAETYPQNTPTYLLLISYLSLAYPLDISC